MSASQYLIPFLLLCHSLVSAQSSLITATEEENEALPPVTLYLTFDDGPGPGSQALNTIIATEKIPATVFLVGENILYNGKIYEAIQRNTFIEIGNHSYSHASGMYRLYYRHPNEVVKDFDRNNDTLRLTHKTARLPGRNIWRVGNRSREDLPDGKPAADSLAVEGYVVFGWDIEWGCDFSDKNTVKTADGMIRAIKHLIENKREFTASHIVLLFHDCMLTDEPAQSELSTFIRKIKKIPRFRFEHLSNYPL